MTDRITALIQQHQGIYLDLGCGAHKSERAIGMDKRDLPGVDIVHDIEVFPWPLPDGCCYRILASHLFEHLKPWLMNEIMDECHRVMKDRGQLVIAMPYPGSTRFWMDPTHIKAWNEVTAQYFSCDYPLWQVYEPKCWKVEIVNYAVEGDINIILAKRGSEDHGRYHERSPTD